MHAAPAADASAVTVTVRYYLDNVPVDYTPCQTMAAGSHTLALFYPFAALLGAANRRWSVRLVCEGGTVTLEKGGLKALISGQGLAGGKTWNGTLTMEETLQPYTFAARRAVQLAPLREGLSLVPQHPASPAYTETLAVLTLPRRTPLRLASLSETPRRELVQKFWTFAPGTEAKYDPALVLTENDRFALRRSFTAQGTAQPIDSGCCTALTVDTTPYLRVEEIEVNW